MRKLPQARADVPVRSREVPRPLRDEIDGLATGGRNDGSYYLLTRGHCDPHDGSVWTYEEDRPLGMITDSEKVGDTKDAAIIRLDPSMGPLTGDVGDRYPVRDVLSLSQIQVGMPFCKLGAVTRETCGTVKGKKGDVIEASVYSLLTATVVVPGFVKNADGTVSAVGVLMSSPDGDDYTTISLVYPLLAKWGLHILPPDAGEATAQDSQRARCSPEGMLRRQVGAILP